MDDKIDLKSDFTDKKTGLTEREEAFLNSLFDQHKGNVRAAMDAVGYPKDTPTRSIINKLKEHISEASKAYLSANSAKAVINIIGILDDPTAPGATNTLKAAKELLDRTGVQAPQEVTKVETQNIFILPAKDI